MTGQESNMEIWIIALIVWALVAAFTWVIFYGGSRRQTIDVCEHGEDPDYCPGCLGFGE